MATSTEFCVLMTSGDSETAAQALASGWVEARLAVCVQVLPMTSFYVWQGESRRDAEYLLLVKTRAAFGRCWKISSTRIIRMPFPNCCSCR